MNTSSGRNRAILLIGPTGSGKTPLGELLEGKGLFGSRCFHFDFGKNLREIALKDKPIGSLTRADIDLIRYLVESRALLEDEQFHIAEKILGGVMLETAEWPGGLRDRALTPDDKRRKAVEPTVEAAVEAVKTNLFGIHGL